MSFVYFPVFTDNMYLLRSECRWPFSRQNSNAGLVATQLTLRFPPPLLTVPMYLNFHSYNVHNSHLTHRGGDVLLFLINRYIHNSSHQADRETPHDGMERQSGSNLDLRAELSVSCLLVGPLTLGLFFKKDFYCLWKKNVKVLVVQLCLTICDPADPTEPARLLCLFNLLYFWIFVLIIHRASLVAQMVKNLLVMQETLVRFLDWEDRLKKGMATHSSILAWRIPWIEEPGKL